MKIIIGIVVLLLILIGLITGVAYAYVFAIELLNVSEYVIAPILLVISMSVLVLCMWSVLHWAYKIKEETTLRQYFSDVAVYRLRLRRENNRTNKGAISHKKHK